MSKVEPSVEIQTVTGMRGLAILIVFVSHAANLGYISPRLGGGFGQFGVMLFFVLSAFLMTKLYSVREFTARNVLAYGGARIGRVFPLYLAVVLLSSVGLLYELGSTKSVVLALAFVSAPGLLWAVPIEVQFYVVFLGIWYCRQRWSTKGIRVVVVLLFGLTAVAMLLAQAVFGVSGVLPFFASYFLFGVLFATAGPASGSGTTVRRRSGWIMSAVAIGSLLLLAPGIRANVLPIHFSVWVDPLTAAAICSVFLLGLRGVGAFKYLALRPIRFVGEISYGFYLLHYFLLEYLAPLSGHIGGPAAAVVVLVVSGTVATVSLLFFERPAQRRIERLFSRRASTIASDSPSVLGLAPRLATHD